MEAWEHRSPFNILKHSCTRELLRAQWWKKHLILTDWTWRKAGGCPNCTESAAPEVLFVPTMLLHLEVSRAKVNSRTAKGWGSAANSRLLYPKSWINVRGKIPLCHTAQYQCHKCLRLSLPRERAQKWIDWKKNVILNKLPMPRVQTTELLLRRSTEGLGGVWVGFCLFGVFPVFLFCFFVCL